MISQGLNPLTNFADLLIVRGGVGTGAAVIVALATFFLITGRKLNVFDAVAPAGLLGLSGWHLGCLWRGACLGTASELPWAWSETGSSITRHPVEIYAAIGLVAAATLVSTLPARVGIRSGAALFVASGIRLLTEPMRLSISGGPVAWYAAGMIFGALVVLISWVAGHRTDLSLAC